MQIEDPRPVKETWWHSIATVLSLVMARIAAYLATGFAAYGAAMYPESFWSPGEHIEDGDRSADQRQ
jgi:hypothetical protein